MAFPRTAVLALASLLGLLVTASPAAASVLTTEMYAAAGDFQPPPRWEGPGRLETLGGAVHLLWFGAVLMVAAFAAGVYKKGREYLEHRRVRLR